MSTLSDSAGMEEGPWLSLILTDNSPVLLNSDNEQNSTRLSTPDCDWFILQ